MIFVKRNFFKYVNCFLNCVCVIYYTITFSAEPFSISLCHIPSTSKDNISAKKREVVNQVLGNVLVPVGCVGGGAKIYKKYADKIESIIPQIKSPKQSAQIFNKVLKSIPNGVCTLGLLGLGLYLGNKVSNFLNEHIYHKKVDRNMKFTDCAPHVDDVCMAVSMMNEDSPFAAKLERVIPLALLVPGYETGTAREH